MYIRRKFNPQVQQLQVELKKENSSTRSHVPTPQSAEIKIRDIEIRRKETHQVSRTKHTRYLYVPKKIRTTYFECIARLN